jgi:hypothetical protein
MKRPILVFAPVLALTACATLFYSRVTVGVVELQDAAEQRIQLRDLPDSRELVVGVGIANCELRNSERRISISVTDEHGKVVINEDRRLKDFRWTPEGSAACAPAFGYIRGEARERTLNSRGDTCGEPIYTGADYGYGTYFRSRKDGVYTLVVRVHGARGSDGSAEVKIMDDGPFMGSGCQQAPADPHTAADKPAQK